MYLPTILGETIEGSTANLRLQVPRTLAFFEVHFPGWPIVPGVVELQWVLNFTRRLFGELGNVLTAENLKFQRLVLPDTEFDLVLTYDAVGRRLDFRFHAGDVRYASGRLLFRDPN